MTYSPPVPKGNQSPYPLQEAPHIVPRDSDPQGAEPRPTGWSGTTMLAAVAGAIGIGAAALFATRKLAFARRTPAARH